MITLNNVTLQRGDKLLFENVTQTFFNKQKIGVVGKNGCGKTSLFALLLGQLESPQGDLSLPAKSSIVTVEQEIPQTSRAALDYVIDADIKLRSCEQSLKKAEAKQEGEKIAYYYECLQNLDGFTAEARASKILDGLGFDHDMMSKSVNALSGGWRMRLNIARALFVPSDILLLDEPTNHLDLDAVIWLESWLQKYSGLLLFISHDRDFLDHLATHILHIENRGMKFYTGNYSYFEKMRAEWLALQEKQYQKQQKQIEHIESYIRRFKAKATKAKQAQSRVKALERMEKIMPAHVDSPFSFEFKEPISLGNPLITLENVSFGYVENNLVLDNVNFQLHNQERIGLLGKNGAGKSTFIKLLSDKLAPKVGNIFKHNHLKIGYFAQHSLDELNEGLSALASLQAIAKTETELSLRKFLGGFDFSGDMVLMPIKHFSGGEKARLALALIVWQSPNILMLDEPTNHLDIDMRQALILALQNYDGAVIIVSHDRFLLSQVADEYWLIAHKQIHRFSDGLEGYQKWLMGSKQSEKITSKKDKTNRAIDREKQKEISRLKQAITRIETTIEKMQEAIRVIDREMIVLSEDVDKNLLAINELQAKRNQFENKIHDNEAEWIEKIENLELLQG